MRTRQDDYGRRGRDVKHDCPFRGRGRWRQAASKRGAKACKPLNDAAEPFTLVFYCPPTRTRPAVDADAFPEPRTTPLKAPAKKTAAKKAAAKKKPAAKSSKPAAKKTAVKAKTAAKKTAVKAKPAAKTAPKPAAKAKSAAKPKSPAKAPGRARSSAAVKPKAAPRFRPAPKAAPAAPAEPLPEIPAELLLDAPRAKKPRKPRGKKAEVAKPPGALETILAQLDDAKAEQVVTIPLDEKSSVADAVVVASGRSNRHVGAIADQLVQKLKEQGHRDLRIEGMPQCDWVLVDAGDVVVHIFRPEVRSFYNLEKLLSAHSPEDWTAQ